MREELIKLLKKWCSDNTDGFPVEAVADAILKDNWIKLPSELGGKYSFSDNPAEDARSIMSRLPKSRLRSAGNVINGKSARANLTMSL